MRETHRHTLNNAVLFLWFVLSFAYTLSPALISIAFIGISLAGALSFKISDFSRFEKTLFILFVAFYTSSFISIFNSADSEEAIRKLILKLPVLCFPLIYSALKNLNKKHLLRMIQVFLFAFYLPAFVSVYNYFSNKTLFDQLILESKPLPIEFGFGIYHIQFSILLAASILFGVFSLMQRKAFEMSVFQRNVTGILVAANVFFIHVLSARTGLLSLYAGLTVIFLFELRHLSFRNKLIGSISAIAIPLILILFSNSLQNRIKNTAEDFKVVWEGKDANDYSFALRVQAWKNASDLIEKHPVMGVGIGDAESELYKNFSQTNPLITKINRKNPHFQLLETAVQSGILSAIFLLLIFVFIFSAAFKGDYLSTAIGIMLFLASCFESILERQASVVGFSVLIALALSVTKQTKIKTP